jgi:hypothetical protein
LARRAAVPNPDGRPETSGSRRIELDHSKTLGKLTMKMWRVLMFGLGEIGR